MDYPADARALTEAVLRRVDRSSTLWQHFELLGDVIVFGGRHAAYYEEMPIDGMTFAEDYFTITVEPSPPHPVIRHFSRTELQAEHHVAETGPLNEFIAERLLQAILNGTD